MFYTLISIVVVNSYLLSLYAPVPKEKKFMEHLAFREALYKALFEHVTGAAAAADAADSLPVAGPVNLMLPPGDTVPVAAKGATAATAATAAVLAAVVDACVEHQRVSMKRAPCVMCKQAAQEGKRGFKGTKSSVFQALSPNIASKRKDRHVARAMTGCSSCNVVLCSRKGCWEAFHSGASGGRWGRKLA